MSPALFFSHLRRDSRGQRSRLLFFIVCLSIGVAAVTSVSSFARAIDQGVRAEARQLLAADLVLAARAPLPQPLLDAAAKLPGTDEVVVLETLTVVALPDESAGAVRSQLTEVKAVGGDYPFYGDLELKPAARLKDLLGADGVVVAPELLDKLGVKVGDGLRIGGEAFTIRGVVGKEPDRVVGAFSLGPRIFLSLEGLERAKLDQYGSRITYRRLLRLPAGTGEAQLDEIAASLRKTVPSGGRVRIETYREAQPAMRQGMKRVESFLSLAALLSLLVGGVGVAQTVRAWLASRLDAIAVLKCLGYRPREVMALYLGQTVLLGLAASLAGIGVGLLIQLLVTRLFSDLLPVSQLSLVQPVAWLQGLILGIGVSVLFSLGPLDIARKVPPVRVFRRDAEPLPPTRAMNVLLWLLLLAGVFLLAWWQSGSLLRAGVFSGGLAVVTLLLSLAARGLIKLALAPRRSAGLLLRQGLSALGRPGAATVSTVVALGLGVFVLLSMYLVESSLAAQIERDLPKNAPTAFLIDIQPEQWPGVREVLQRESESFDSVPVVMARIAAIDGVGIDQLAEERSARREREGDERGDGGDREDWALKREQRLTYLEKLPVGNQIVEGSLWQDPQAAELSLEKEFAEQIGAKVGSVVRFDVQGVPIETKVSSIRTVDWSTFGINFYLVVEPGVLEEAPQYRIAAARLDGDKLQKTQDELVAAFPNVTMIRIREVLDRVADILGKLGAGVRVLGLLTVLTGLAILAGAVGATQVRRRAEVALLKTLGMTRRQIVGAFAIEYALLGTVASVIGAVGGSVLSYLVLTQAMEVPADRIEWVSAPWWLPITALLTIVLATVAGLLASLRALAERPIAVLRGES